MDTARLKEIVDRICQPGKGILAADESSGTIKKRFDSINVESTEQNRRDYRNMLFTLEGLETHISGVILFDETVDQKDDSGQTFPQLLDSKNIVPGIKTDEGKEEHPVWGPQTVTRGLKGLGERLEEYTERSAGTLGFTKWRQVILVDPEPSDGFLDYAMHVMAEQAAWSQSRGYVPICEPEVLMDGSHSLEQCAAVTERTLKALFKNMEAQGVEIPLSILKTNMVLSGKETKTDTSYVVGAETVKAFMNSVPSELPGIVFLSGGQTSIQATENLDACAKEAQAKNAPWVLSFSYGRALQEDALKAWSGEAENVTAAQQALDLRARMNGAAQQGQYDPAMEKELAVA